MTENEQIEYLLFGYLKGSLDKTQKGFIEKWMAESEKNQKEFERYKRIFTEQQRHFPDNEVILSREKIKNILLQRLFTIKKRDKRVITSLSFTIFILVGVFAGYSPFVSSTKDVDLFAGITTIQTEQGETATCVLPDSTKIWLNYNTKIEYQIANEANEKTRQIKIIGEAFFDVAKIKKIPFEVITENTKIRVYGTQFKVRLREKELAVTLVEGSMAVFTNNDDKKVSQLVPGDQVILNNEGKLLSKQTINTSHARFWTEGKYEYKNVTLKEIVRDLNEIYGFNIVVKDNTLNKESYRFVIDRKKSLLQTLQFLKETTNLNYSINGTHILLTKN